MIEYWSAGYIRCFAFLSFKTLNNCSTERRGFGYRNMPYFKLKILQVCGFLNSGYVPMSF